MDSTSRDNLVAPAVSWLTTYYQSAEAAMDRRVGLTQWANSICFALCAAIGATLSWGYQNEGGFFVASVISLFICMFGYIYTSFWERQLDTYRQLSLAKFQVLSEMANTLSIVHTSQELQDFFRAFEVEYHSLRSATKLPLSNLLLSAPSYERMLPRMFRVLFAIVIPFALVYATFNTTLSSPARELPQSVQAEAGSESPPQELSAPPPTGSANTGAAITGSAPILGTRTVSEAADASPNGPQLLQRTRIDWSAAWGIGTVIVAIALPVVIVIALFFFVAERLSQRASSPLKAVAAPIGMAAVGAAAFWLPDLLSLLNSTREQLGEHWFLATPIAVFFSGLVASVMSRERFGARFFFHLCVAFLISVIILFAAYSPPFEWNGHSILYSLSDGADQIIKAYRNEGLDFVATTGLIFLAWIASVWNRIQKAM